MLHNSYDEVFQDEAAIEAFRVALASGDDTISAATDWAPIHQRIKQLSGLKGGERAGWAYDLTRFPLLGLLWCLIVIEFILYCQVRQLVNFIEYATYWWGKKYQLRKALRTASNYDEWKAAALRMDDYLGFSEWKRTSAYPYYDSELVRRVRDNLQDLRTKDDTEGLRTVLEICLRPNFAGCETANLYSETYFGTKDLLEAYLQEVEQSLAHIRTHPSLGMHEKQAFYRAISRHFGTTALCLSGGATLGYYHFGVLRALLAQDLLPRVIAGTSAGALVAALICCRTNEELEPLLNPALANKLSALEDDFSTWSKRLWKTGARFDAVVWARKAMWFTLGNMTFKEAYERTGRVLNVSVIPYETHSPTKLLNYLTAPDCVIYTACIASAAVPGLLQPVVLMNKTSAGKLVPWQFQGRHKDGSLRVDIPLQSLHLLFNCNFSIVSQVNPHISLFFFQPKGAIGRPVAHRRGRGWRGGYLLSAAEQFLKIELTKNFRVIRDLELMPEFGGQNWTNVFLQKFEGSVTIWPKSRFGDWLRLLTDPDEKELARMIDAGQRATWPKLHMIANRLKIEREIEGGRDSVREALRAQSNGAVSDGAYDPMDATSAFETDSDLDGVLQRARTTARPPDGVLDVDRHNFSDRYPQSEKDPTDKAAGKAKRKAVLRRLGIARGTETADSSDGARRRSSKDAGFLGDTDEDGSGP